MAFKIFSDKDSLILIQNIHPKTVLLKFERKNNLQNKCDFVSRPPQTNHISIYKNRTFSKSIVRVVKKNEASFPFIPASLVAANYLHSWDARAIFIHILQRNIIITFTQNNLIGAKNTLRNS